MSEQAYDKKRIALDQIETALRIYAEDGDLFSVITLAGAAEEIFGKLITRQGGSNSLDRLAKAAVEIHEHLGVDQRGDPRAYVERANRARNALKHLDAGGSPTVTLDLDQEARDLLNRAIDNYWLLETSLTPAMDRFLRGEHGGEGG